MPRLTSNLACPFFDFKPCLSSFFLTFSHPSQGDSLKKKKSRQDLKSNEARKYALLSILPLAHDVIIIPFFDDTKNKFMLLVVSASKKESRKKTSASIHYCY